MIEGERVCMVNGDGDVHYWVHFAQGGGDGGGRKCRSASRPKMARDNTAWPSNNMVWHGGGRGLVAVVVGGGTSAGGGGRRMSWSWTDIFYYYLCLSSLWPVARRAAGGVGVRWRHNTDRDRRNTTDGRRGNLTREWENRASSGRSGTSEYLAKTSQSLQEFQRTNLVY